MLLTAWNIYNFFQDVGEWLEKVDISEVISNQINKFQQKIGKSNSTLIHF